VDAFFRRFQESESSILNPDLVPLPRYYHIYHYRSRGNTVLSSPSPRDYRKFVPIPAVITAVTAVIPHSPLPCHPLIHTLAVADIIPIIHSYLGGGRGREDKDVGTRGIAGCRELRTTATLALFLLDRVHHDAHCGVELHRHEACTQYVDAVQCTTRRAYFAQVTRTTQQVSPTQNTGPACIVLETLQSFSHYKGT
jgi:hypothetical protein